MCYAKKGLSPRSLGQWLPILARCDLKWVDHNHRVMWLIYYVTTLYSQKRASPVSQRQWKLNLVGLWVRVKRPHLLFQVTCRSSDRVHFEKRHVPTNSNVMYPLSQLEISNRKTHKSNAFFVILKRYQDLIHIDIHHFKYILTVEVSSLPYCFYYNYSGITWGYYQWVSKLLTQIALCKHVHDIGKQIVKPKF